jgi:uncharacterized membrane protein HdeD (DUF308 family)
MKRGGLLVGIIALVAGILVLVWPGILAWVIGIFLIVWGILAILGRT